MRPVSDCYICDFGYSISDQIHRPEIVLTGISYTEKQAFYIYKYIDKQIFSYAYIAYIINKLNSKGKKLSSVV